MESEDFHVVGRREVPPDPGLTAALSSGHGLATALADLVDNSLDAGARRVHIRVVIMKDLIHQILVADDGEGMTSSEIDSAMSLGRPKGSGGKTLGHFGVGLKAASFSQADVLTVLSRSTGSTPQGRRMHRREVEGFFCDVLDTGDVRSALARPLPGLKVARGTVVLWDQLRSVPHGGRQHTNAREASMRSGAFTHLGLVFHRLLRSERLTISWDVFDDDEHEAGAPMRVEPVDPFDHRASGRRGYPLQMTARPGRREVPMHCAIWPAGSTSSDFAIQGRSSVDAFQGLYVYRNDRLLSFGGWLDVTAESRRRRLARVAIDVTGLDDLIQMSAEKDKVVLSQDLIKAIATATANDKTTFADFLAAAEEVFVRSNTRRKERPPMLPPGEGIHSDVRSKITDHAVLHNGRDPFKIRWTDFGDDPSFIELDRPHGTIWLNRIYRTAILKGTRGSVNDVPMIKALIYLLFEDVMKGPALGSKEKENYEFWRDVLTSAAETEDRTYHAR